MLVVGHSPKSSVWDGFEVSVSSLRSIMNMLLFIVVLGPPVFILVSRIMNRLLHMIFIDHLLLFILYNFFILND